MSSARPQSKPKLDTVSSEEAKPGDPATRRRILDAALKLLWTLISLRMWEDLVLQRGWTAADYEQRIGDLAVATLTRR